MGPLPRCMLNAALSSALYSLFFLWTNSYTAVRPILPKIRIQFINNSPRVEEGTVEADFILTRPASKVTCQLGKGSQEDCKTICYACVHSKVTNWLRKSTMPKCFKIATRKKREMCIPEILLAVYRQFIL